MKDSTPSDCFAYARNDTKTRHREQTTCERGKQNLGIIKKPPASAGERGVKLEAHVSYLKDCFSNL